MVLTEGYPIAMQAVSAFIKTQQIDYQQFHQLISEQQILLKFKENPFFQMMQLNLEKLAVNDGFDTLFVKMLLWSTWLDFHRIDLSLRTQFIRTYLLDKNIFNETEIGSH